VFLPQVLELSLSLVYQLASLLIHIRFLLHLVYTQRGGRKYDMGRRIELHLPNLIFNLFDMLESINTHRLF
jgi:hypothetical protein